MSRLLMFNSNGCARSTGLITGPYSPPPLYLPTYPYPAPPLYLCTHLPTYLLEFLCLRMHAAAATATAIPTIIPHSLPPPTPENTPN